MQSAAERLIHEGFRSVKAEGRIEGQRQGRIEGQLQGKIEGKAEGVLTVLEARGIQVEPAHRAKILACADAPTLDRWLRAAATCATADALFAH